MLAHKHFVLSTHNMNWCIKWWWLCLHINTVFDVTPITQIAAAPENTSIFHFSYGTIFNICLFFHYFWSDWPRKIYISGVLTSLAAYLFWVSNSERTAARENQASSNEILHISYITAVICSNVHRLVKLKKKKFLLVWRHCHLVLTTQHWWNKSRSTKNL